METLIVLPARYSSTRLPGKPLLRQTGKFLIEHVYDQVMKSQIAKTSAVVVATDDLRIVTAVKSFGGRVVLTRPDHPSGTDRVAEVANQFPNASIILNIQGDEPEFDPAAVDELYAKVSIVGTDMATLATPIRDAALYGSPHCVKVVSDAVGRAMYFSRSPIPFVRDAQPNFSNDPPLAYQHLGAYAYRRELLMTLSKMPPHPLELAEQLEQLRVLASGHTIRLGIVPYAHRGVDTPSDYAAFVESYRSQRSQHGQHAA